MRNFNPIDVFYAQRYLELMELCANDSVTQAFLTSDVGTEDAVVCEVPLRVIKLMATRANLASNPNQAHSNIQVCRLYLKVQAELALHDTPLIPASNKMQDVLERGYQ